MADAPNKEGQPVLRNEFGPHLEAILDEYLDARRNQRFGKSTSVWAEMQQATEAVRSSPVATSFPQVVFQASVGQGNWATIPWIAALDSRETRKTSEGVYVIYLFRADMTGVYLTLNQATSPVMGGYTQHGALELKRRAGLLRKRSGSLLEHGFTVDEGIDLRGKVATARGYEASTAAFKLYERGSVPSDEQLFADLSAALRVYKTLIPSRRLFGSE